MQKFDLLIVNKGLSGLILACGLSRYFNIAIISNDININDSKKNVWSATKVALINFVSIKILKHLQAWNQNINFLLNSFNTLEIMEKSSNILIKDMKIIFESGYFGYLELGYIIDTEIL